VSATAAFPNQIITQEQGHFPTLLPTPVAVEQYWRTAAIGGFVRPPYGLVHELEEMKEARPARVDHGRWLIDCVCNGAAFAWVENPRAACLGCGRVWRVKWPTKQTRERGEALLLLRPDPANRNWDPVSESLADLREENKAARRVGLM